MAILKPTDVSPTNAKDAKMNITFSWRNFGDRQYHYQLSIYKLSDNSLVYDSGKVSSLNTFCILNGDILENGISYKYNITVWNQIGDAAIGDWYVLKCSSTPSCQFSNVGIGQEVLNSSYLFTGEYFQAEDVPIKSWDMILYDDNNFILSSVHDQYSSDISYKFEGLITDKDYSIELQVRSQDDLLFSTGRIPFHVRYEVPIGCVALNAENVNTQAAVRLQWKVIQITGEVESGTISYEDGEVIDLTKGKIIFQDGMPNFGKFNLKLFIIWTNLINKVIHHKVDTCLGVVDCTSKDNRTELVRIKSPLGDIWIGWEYEDNESGRFHVYKNFYGYKYHTMSELISPTEGDRVYLGIEFDNILVDAHAKVIKK